MKIFTTEVVFELLGNKVGKIACSPGTSLHGNTKLIRELKHRINTDLKS